MKLSLGAFIATLRKEKGLTQKQLAEMLSVSDKTVSHWEREESSPDISLIPVIADIFGITTDELLRGYRKDEKEEIPTEEKRDTAVLYALESAYGKFRTKNLIGPALSIVAVLCGFIVQYFKTIYVGYLVFLTLLVVPVLLTALFRGGFSSHLSSPYIEKDVLKDYFYKANRISANCLYLSFGCFLIFTLYVIRFNYPYIAGLFLLFLAGALAVLVCEALLRKSDILKKSGKPLKIKKILVLRIACILLSAVLLYAGYMNHMTIDTERYVYENAEYTLIENVSDFVAFMETEKDPPDELYRSVSVTPVYSSYSKGETVTMWLDFYTDSREIIVVNPDYTEYVEFTYNNLEVADSRQIKEGFVIYTHAQLIAAQEIAEKKADTLIALYFAYYIAVIIIMFIAYKFIRRRILKGRKSDKFTLIKDF